MAKRHARVNMFMIWYTYHCLIECYYIPITELPAYQYINPPCHTEELKIAFKGDNEHILNYHIN